MFLMFRKGGQEGGAGFVFCDVIHRGIIPGGCHPGR